MSGSWLMHAANLVFLASFLARDVLWLRVISVVGCSLLIAFFLTFDPVPWAAVAWQAGFAAIHAAWSVRLWLDRRPVPLTPDEERLAQLVFAALPRREVARLCRAGAWHAADAGQALCGQGERLDRLMLVADGTAEVRVDGAPVAVLVPGRFVGEVAWILGEATSAAVVAAEPVRYLAWPRPALERVLRDHPAIHGAVQRVLGADLAEKLRARARRPA